MLVTCGLRRAGGLALVMSTLGLSVLAGPASAEFGISSFSASSLAADGSQETGAGVNPFSSRIEFSLNTVPDPTYPPFPISDENVKDIELSLPAGFVGNPEAMPKCPRLDIIAARCAPAAQVGVITVVGSARGENSYDTQPIFNMIPRDGEVADLAFSILGVPTHISIRVDATNKYRVKALVSNVPEAKSIVSTKVTLWGTPADAVHDGFRGSAYKCPLDQDDPRCSDPAFATFVQGGFKAGVDPQPFLSNPTSCDAVPETSVRMRSWDRPDRWVTASSTQSKPSSCDRLSFAPSIDAHFETPRPDSPSGLAFKLSVPQSSSIAGTATPPLRKAVVTLPEGVSMNPSAANGLAGCSDAQIDLSGQNAVGCPAASKLGNITIKTPLLADPLTGSVYLGEPLAGKKYRIFFAAANPLRGVSIRLEGVLTPDPQTGRLTTTFDDNPQLPFSELTLTFDGGPQSPLAMPQQCGPATTTAALTPWAGANAPTATVTSTTTIAAAGGGPSCDGGFSPTFTAGSAGMQAGATSPLSVTVARADGQQFLQAIDKVAMPEGLLGKVGSVPQCAEAQATAGTCPAESRIGQVQVAAGAGSAPLWIPQAGKAATGVYLGGPYKGAPFSLSIVVPAQAGPFDLGTVVVRSALFVDPIDGHVTALTDPMPTILDGIPLRVREIRLLLDRAGFMLNPTSCAEKQITADIRSTAGTSVGRTARYQVGECAALALKPSLGLTLSGKGQTKDGGHPAITAALTQPAGQANLKKVRVALPLSLALDPDNSRSDGLCSFVEGSKPAPQCPASSVVGRATATTPILGEPLSGPVYFTKNERKDPKSGRSIKTLPKLVIPLVGQNGVKLTLTGTSAVVDDQLVTTFDNIPDAPVSSFKLDITGGKKGILVISGDKADICASTQIAEQQIDGQNNKSADTDVFIQTPSCPIKVISKKVTAKAVTLKVGGLGAGKVTVTGKGIKKTVKTISKSTVATITAKRSGKARPTRVTVSFKPAAGGKAKTATARLP
jgi:hypothetical protein